MKDIPQNNVERSLDTTSKVADMLTYPGDEMAAAICILGDIAVSLAVIADTLIGLRQKDGDAE